VVEPHGPEAIGGDLVTVLKIVAASLAAGGITWLALTLIRDHGPTDKKDTYFYE
jgi:hypothetical protein